MRWDEKVQVSNPYPSLQLSDWPWAISQPTHSQLFVRIKKFGDVFYVLSSMVVAKQHWREEPTSATSTWWSPPHDWNTFCPASWKKVSEMFLQIYHLQRGWWFWEGQEENNEEEMREWEEWSYGEEDFQVCAEQQGPGWNSRMNAVKNRTTTVWAERVIARNDKRESGALQSFILLCSIAASLPYSSVVFFYSHFLGSVNDYRVYFHIGIAASFISFNGIPWH